MQDIRGHWAEPCIEYLLNKGVFSGYRDGTFRPEQAITRAEFSAIVSHAFNPQARRPGKQFLDLLSSHWAWRAVDQVYRAEWLSGFTDGTFGPNQLMPRVQVLVALASGLELVSLYPAIALVKATFADAPKIPNYAIAGVAAALEHDLVVNFPQRDRLRPLDATTRAEAAAFVYQALVLQRGVPTVLPPHLIAQFEPGGNQLATELRGVWLTNVDSTVLFSRQNLAAAIERLADCGFNTLYPTVWNGGFTLFPSAIAESELGERQRLYPGLQRSPQEDIQDGRDMLAECLDLAHARGLRVIPWFEYGFFARRGNSLRDRQPGWFTQQRDGTQTDQHQMEWLNPFHHEVQQFYLVLIKDLVTRYDVDGFQIDDHFGLPTEFGYDPYTAQRYRAETGQLVPRDPENEQWMTWRANKITQFVVAVAQTVKRIRPQAVFSVSPNPPKFSYRNFLQDWPRWLSAATVDEVIIQTYRWDLASFVRELQKPSLEELRVQVPISIGVLAGLRNRPMALPVLKQQCQAVRANGYAGMVFFFYESVWQTSGESPDLRQATLQRLLKSSV
ncbi:MAG: family 10 glycosylhydrolase [Leptolyngbyaceae cyanobacterium]